MSLRVCGSWKHYLGGTLRASKSNSSSRNHGASASHGANSASGSVARTSELEAWVGIYRNTGVTYIWYSITYQNMV